MHNCVSKATTHNPNSYKKSYTPWGSWEIRETPAKIKYRKTD